MLIGINQLSVLCGESRLVAEKWLLPLNQAMTEFRILDSAQRVAMFLAQCAHESAGFVFAEENLNYSAEALARVFSSHFRVDEFEQYAHKPQAIANRVYANRMGNGDEAGGDGWRYRGRGLIQLTGRDNYAAAASDLREPLLEKPDLVVTPPLAARTAAWYWVRHGCNELADAGDFAEITRRINGGLNGQADRLAWLERVQRELV